MQLCIVELWRCFIVLMVGRLRTLQFIQGGYRYWWIVLVTPKFGSLTVMVMRDEIFYVVKDFVVCLILTRFLCYCALYWLSLYSFCCARSLSEFGFSFIVICLGYSVDSQTKLGWVWFTVYIMWVYGCCLILNDSVLTHVNIGYCNSADLKFAYLFHGMRVMVQYLRINFLLLGLVVVCTLLTDNDNATIEVLWVCVVLLFNREIIFMFNMLEVTYFGSCCYYAIGFRGWVRWETIKWGGKMFVVSIWLLLVALYFICVRYLCCRFSIMLRLSCWLFGAVLKRNIICLRTVYLIDVIDIKDVMIVIRVVDRTSGYAVYCGERFVCLGLIVVLRSVVMVCFVGMWMLRRKF
eukprot:gene2854-1839_t